MARDDRCVAMATALFLGSVALLLGLPTSAERVRRRARSLGRLAVAVYAIGVLGRRLATRCCSSSSADFTPEKYFVRRSCPARSTT